MLGEQDYMAVLAVWCEPVSEGISLLTGKNTGKFRKFDLFFGNGSCVAPRYQGLRVIFPKSKNRESK
jgi:hypothetical protein